MRRWTTMLARSVMPALLCSSLEEDRADGRSDVRVGIGMPGTIPGAPGGLIVEWARKTEEGPFSSLGVLDRVRYDNLEPFAMLAAAAAVTSHVRLVTMVVIAPIRNTVLLAKHAPSVTAMSSCT